ncbi:unnamed protein product [Pseudo-nitzschia multistriata]|uniref:Uncharacterized protein n=1 Tax=Pseudo-nitzschia multistriata TaxID=183589 RepID=A0A448Z0Z3_9STRA|nr:unnamed protein product [Pseudo-nitzschia multistriata]
MCLFQNIQLPPTKDWIQDHLPSFPLLRRRMTTLHVVVFALSRSITDADLPEEVPMLRSRGIPQEGSLRSCRLLSAL